MSNKKISKIYMILVIIIMAVFIFFQTNSVKADNITYTTIGGTWEQESENTWTMDKDGDGIVDITLVKGEDEWQYLFSVSDTEAEYYAWEEVLPEGYTVDGEGTRENPLIFTNNGVIINKANEEVTPLPVGGFTLTKEITNVNEDSSKLFRFDVVLSSDDDSLMNLLSGTKTFGDITFKDGVGVTYLSHGQSISVTGIPSGITWSITESNTDGYTTSWLGGALIDGQNGCQGVIAENSNTSIVCSNTRIDETVLPPGEGGSQEPDVSSLTVYKSVIGESSSTDVFSFHAVFSGLAENKTYVYHIVDGSDLTFLSDATGVADVSFSLSDTESVVFVDLPVGCQYQILEASSDYMASYEILNAVSTVQQKGENTESNTPLSTAKETLDLNEEATVQFTNTRVQVTKPTASTINIQVEKVWNDENNLKGIRPNEITVYLLQDEDVVATAKLNEISGWKTTFTDLNKYEDDGVTECNYHIKELSVPGYATTIITTSGVVEEMETQQVVITNTLQNVGDLKVSKTVKGVGADLNKEFRFTITLSKDDTPITGTYKLDNSQGTKTGTIVFDETGQATFTLKNGESIVIKNLPFNTEYQIKEMSYKNYTASDSGQYTGTITAGKVETVNVLNTFVMPYQNLSVSKIVTGNMGNKTKEFSFRLMLTKSDFEELPNTLAYTKGSETGVAIPSSDGIYEFKLSHGETIIFYDLPYQTHYKVVELDGESDGYTVTSEDASGLVLDKDVEVSFINKKNMGIPTDANTNVKLMFCFVGCMCCLLLFDVMFRKRNK